MLWGGELIRRDGVVAGQGDVGGRLHPISVSLRPLYDPTNERIRR